MILTKFSFWGSQCHFHERADILRTGRKYPFTNKLTCLAAHFLQSQLPWSQNMIFFLNRKTYPFSKVELVPNSSLEIKVQAHTTLKYSEVKSLIHTSKSPNTVNQESFCSGR